jgi:hypothetical protein
MTLLAVPLENGKHVAIKRGAVSLPLVSFLRAGSERRETQRNHDGSNVSPAKFPGHFSAL